MPPSDGGVYREPLTSKDQTQIRVARIVGASIVLLVALLFAVVLVVSLSNNAKARRKYASCDKIEQISARLDCLDVDRYGEP